jgi:hypothetical protein
MDKKEKHEYYIMPQYAYISESDRLSIGEWLIGLTVIAVPLLEPFIFNWLLNDPDLAFGTAMILNVIILIFTWRVIDIYEKWKNKNKPKDNQDENPYFKNMPPGVF